MRQGDPLRGRLDYGVAGALRRLRRARAVSESGRSVNRRSGDPVYASYRQSRLSWVVYGIDVRSGVRLLHVEAVQSALIVAMLALGIGANLAIFGAIDLAPLRLAQRRDAGRTGAVIDVRRRPDRHRRSLMRLEVVCSLSAFSF